MDYVKNAVDRLAAIKKQAEALDSEKASLEAILLKEYGEKNSTMTILGSNSKVTISTANTLKILAPALLKKLFGDNYKTCVTKETKFKIADAEKKLLVSVLNGNVSTKVTTDEFLNSFATVEETAVLKKKLKGVSLEKDTESIRNTCYIDKEKSESAAKIYAEILNGEKLKNLAQNDDAETFVALAKKTFGVDKKIVIKVT